MSFADSDGVSTTEVVLWARRNANCVDGTSGQCNHVMIDSSSVCNRCEVPPPGDDMAGEHDIVLSPSGYYSRSCDPWAQLFCELNEQVGHLSVRTLRLLNIF